MSDVEYTSLEKRLSLVENAIAALCWHLECDITEPGPITPYYVLNEAGSLLVKKWEA